MTPKGSDKDTNTSEEERTEAEDNSSILDTLLGIWEVMQTLGLDKLTLEAETGCSG